jgi:hypothetical protein
MSPKNANLERFSPPPRGYWKHVGEIVLGGTAIIVAAVSNLPEVIAIPTIIGGGVAAIHGGVKAFESTINSD